WLGWRFAPGPQHMNGQRALMYSRVRVNRLDPSESDVTRGERQQAVLQAMTGRLASIGTLTRMPFIGGDLLKPLTTDLSTGQLLQLGWVKFRSGNSRALHCRLGGSGATVGSQSVIVSSPENISVIHMVLGNSAPQPPSPGSGPYGPGCVTGNHSLH
ncbi:MAG: polyisoprenyl-teichoic acid--peptidoglycan teichoic acid transferase, partial [Gaiellaceae bacterium]|nr:polyisoprenyl-teichoic acid--peptidoglycan teichoic acid transferase [Gaiellaceae bacterium]